MKLTTLTTLTLITLFLSACGDDYHVTEQVGVPGATGATGPAGAAGADGQDALADLEVLNITASRDYDPSVFSPSSSTLGAAAVQLPESLPATGSAGTGWASIKVGDSLFCFQGNGVNNSDPGTKFNYKGLATGSECYMGTTSADLTVVEYFDDTVITVSVHGGGVSAAIRGFVEVEAVIKFREFN